MCVHALVVPDRSCWYSAAVRPPCPGPAVRDARTDAGFVLPVLTGERARDVFDHPYPHAARHGVPTTARAA